MMTPLRISLIYAVASTLWILFSDRLVDGSGFDQRTINLLQTAKGWFFVFVTASLLYLFVRRAVKSVERYHTDREKARELLRKSEDQYRILIENSNSIILRLDAGGTITFINEFALKFFGYLEEEILGRNVTGTLVPETESTGRDLRRMIEDITDHPDRYMNNVNENMRRNGERVWIAWTNKPVYDECGNTIGLLCIGNDITERRRAEDERIVLQERLQRAEKMEALGVMAGGVAHDLNNVLGILVGYSELLLGEIPADSGLRGHVEKILIGGERAAAIVQDLLTLARRGVHSENIVNLNTLIGEIRKTPEFENLLSSHPGVGFRTELAPDLLNIKGSRSHLYKTVMNLLTNAAEAIPDSGTVTLTTGNRNLDRPVQGYDDVRVGDYAVLSISDTGSGIASADMRHIFEPFYTKKVMGRSGTGLGLAVVWGTVKDHQAYLDVQSEPSKGATFTLYFPVTREAPAAAPAVIPAAEYFGSNESILVVDDIPEQRELAASMLGRLNFKVRTAASGEEAVEILKDNPADLVLLDMIMDPGMDGLDTYRKILERHPGQKAIIVSGFSETDRVLQAQALGAGPYVRKPYILEKLGLAVRKGLARN